jgi:hypothetical protein
MQGAEAGFGCEEVAMALNENFIPLGEGVASRRIFSPFAYPLVRELNVVPIVHTEAFRLGAWFPVAWQQRADGVQLVTVRAFAPDLRAVPAAVRTSVKHLPVLLQAFPFGLEPGHEIRPGTPKMLCDEMADEPESVGAPITTPDRKLSRATELRFQALDFFCDHSAPTEALGRALHEDGLLEPWTLSFDVEGRKIEVPDILMVRQDLYATGRLAPVLGRFGPMAAELIGIHRLSLFRAGPLLAAARTALTAKVRETGTLSLEREDWAG